MEIFGSVSMILNSSSEIEFCRLLAAGIVSNKPLFEELEVC